MHPRRIESVGADLAAALPSAALGGPAPAAPGAGERFRCHRALRALIELLGRERPVALLLDDLHWADDASIELVLHLLRRPARAPHLLAFALRPMEPAPRLLHATRAADGQLISLPPLPHAASLELIGHVPDAALRERLAREAGGNPLFLGELARVARDPGGALPPTLLAAVRLEVGAMPPRGARAARRRRGGRRPVRSRAGGRRGRAGRDRLAGAARRPGRRRPRVRDGRRPRVPLPPSRCCAGRSTTPPRRPGGSPRTSASPPRSPRAAPARPCAPSTSRSARGPATPPPSRCSREAAATAADTAPATAARWYAAGARLLPCADRAARAALLGPMAVALADAGRLHESREALLDVLALLPSERTPERLAVVARTAAVEHLLGRHGDAHRRLLAALADAPPEARAPLALEMATAGFHAGDAAAMRDWAARAAVDAVGQEALRAGAEALGALGAQRTGDAEAAATLMARALDRLARIDDPEIAAGLERRRARGHRRAARRALRGRLRDARPRALRRARHAPGRPARPARASRARSSSSSVCTWARRSPTPSWRRRAPACRACGRCSTPRCGPRRCSTTTAARAPRPCAQRRGVRRAARRARAQRRHPHGPLRRRRDPRGAGPRALPARADRRRGRAASRPSTRRGGRGCCSSRVRAALAADRADDARAFAAELARHADGHGASRPARCAPRAPRPSCCSPAATRRPRPRAAPWPPREAAGRIGARRDELAARLLAGRALAAAGDRTEAVAVLRAVTVDAARGGAFLVRDAAARELRRLGSRVSVENRRAAGAEGPRSLTARELDVARLVAEGRPNKQVAAALFLSEKTVEHHLSRVYAKYGVRSRAELTAVFAAGAGGARRRSGLPRCASGGLGERQEQH